MFNKIISKLESIIQINIRFYIKNGLYLIISAFIGVCISVVLPIFYTNYFIPEDYGKFVFILSFIGFLSLFTLPGMKTAISEAMAKNKDIFYRIGVKARIKWSIIGFISAISISLYYFTKDLSLFFGFIIVACYVLFMVFDSFSDYYVAKKKFKLLSISKILIGLSQLLFTVLILVFLPNFHLILITFLFSPIMVTILFFTYENKNIPKINNLNEAINASNANAIQESLHYGRFLTLFETFQVIRTQFDAILIGIFISYEVLAIYAIALIIPNLFKQSITLTTTLFFPGLAELPDKEANRIYKKRLPIALLLYSGFCGIILLFIPVAIRILYPPTYEVAIFYSIILMISFLAWLPANFHYIYYTSQKRLHELKILTYIGLTLEILLLIILIPLFGIWGALITRLISRTFSTVLSTILLFRIKF